MTTQESPPTDEEFRKRFAAELERAKLDAMKELAYGASHEINNPLANIALRAQTLLKREDDVDKRKALEAIHRAAMRAHEMISDLMLFARPPKLEKREVSLPEVAAGVVQELGPRSREQSTELYLEPDGDSCVNADPVQLAVALRALMDNSLDALGKGGTVTVTVGGARLGGGWLRVTDDGPGIPEEVRPHVFDPFFSGREAGRGLGFGLSKCWRIVTEHGGEVRLDSAPNQGVIASISLPGPCPTPDQALDGTL